MTVRNLEHAFRPRSIAIFGASARAESVGSAVTANVVESGQMARDLALPALNPKTDRAMICGSWDMLKSVKDVLVKRGFNEGNTTKPGDFVVERAFVDQ